MFLDKFADSLDAIVNASKLNSALVLKFLGILFAVHILNICTGLRLSVLGIWPRKLHGIIGIFCFSFIHGDFTHLFLNSIPFFILANLLLVNGKTFFYIVSATIMIKSGAVIWLLGKRGIHIGASALVMGYFGFILSMAYFKTSCNSIVIAVICLYYLSGLFLNLFPGEKHVSWEGHVFGFIAGITTSYSFVMHAIG